jgi:hypothetical protein
MLQQSGRRIETSRNNYTLCHYYDNQFYGAHQHHLLSIVTAQQFSCQKPTSARDVHATTGTELCWTQIISKQSSNQ